MTNIDYTARQGMSGNRQITDAIDCLNEQLEELIGELVKQTEEVSKVLVVLNTNLITLVNVIESNG